MVALTQNRLSAQYGWFCHGRSHMVICITTSSIRSGFNPSLQYCKLKDGRLCQCKNEELAATHERKLFSKIPWLKTFGIRKEIDWYIHFLAYNMSYAGSRVVTDRQTDRQTDTQTDKQIN